MAAYAALVSLMHIIEQIHHHHHPPISLDEGQAKSLTEKISFLQHFLENYFHDRTCKHVESRIVETAYAAEDVIESRIVDQILDGSSTDRVAEISSSDQLHNDLQKLIQDMEFIIAEVMEIKGKRRMRDMLQEKLALDKQNSRASGDSSRSPSMVGNDDVLTDLLDKLTGQQSDRRQIIPIVGMGGIGKTTLATSIYTNPAIAQHFDVIGWMTISQEYSVHKILVEVLLCLKNIGSKESFAGKTENELGEKLHKYLMGRRYLVVMDDMWSIEAWDEVKFYFPDYNNRSRIIVTTRLSQVAFQLTDSYIVDVNFLNEEDSWNLLCMIVFGEKSYPHELEEIGKAIAKNCKGLPLSIVVIGGLLRKSKRTTRYWEHIAENINPILNLEDNERCLKILSTSYYELPVHLKPCFLYMGVFREDKEIRTSTLVKLWVAEGFLKPISGKNLEVVAKEYLKDLVDRNLVLVHKFGFGSKIKSCGVHDLLRDLCLREAQETKFLYVTMHTPQGINAQRRVAIHQSPAKWECIPSQHVPSFTRSLMCDAPQDMPCLNLRLLRVLNAADRTLFLRDTTKNSRTYDVHLMKAVFQLVNSRYISFRIHWIPITQYLSSIPLFWNLQTLIVYGAWATVAPLDIWKMRQLKHVKVDLLYLLDPPSSSHATEGQDGLIVLENLQSLSQIQDFTCGEEVVKRIPNIKKLGISYFRREGALDFCLNNIGRLHKLESLCCKFDLNSVPSRSYFHQSLSFPHSLRKLTLFRAKFRREDVATKIGVLPLLEVLKLDTISFGGSEWETVEEQFSCLRFLSIESCDELECWTTESSHFPRLEHLVLRNLHKLREIPADIGHIPTLGLVELVNCSNSCIISAKEMMEEQEELGNEDLRVRVRFFEDKSRFFEDKSRFFWDKSRFFWDKSREHELQQSLASHNFTFEMIGANFSVKL